MQVCSQELGIYCCKRDYDCCTNRTLVFALGKPDVVAVIPNHHTAHPTPAHPPHPPVSAATHTAAAKDDANRSTTLARDTIIGVGAGFAAAIAILLVGCCFWLTKRRPSERYRDGDRKSDAFEMDTMGSSRSAIHKDLSVSVSQLDTPSSPAEMDAPTRLELDTRRATMINQVVEMFELDATPSDDGRRPDGSVTTHGMSREGSSWEENHSAERRAPDIPIPEEPPVLVPNASRLRIPDSHLSIPEIFMSATATRPVSEFRPVAGRVPTPLPDDAEPESSNDIPPVPDSSPVMALPEVLTARTFTVERSSRAKSYDVLAKPETTSFQGAKREAGPSTRPVTSGPSSRRSILKTATTDVPLDSEITPQQQFETRPAPQRPDLETSSSQIHRVEPSDPEQSSSIVATVAESLPPRLAAAVNDVPSNKRTSSEQPSRPNPAPEPASKPG